MREITYSVRAGDIEHGGTSSAWLKVELRKEGVNEELARRAGVIAFEGEMNLILYATHGGTLRVAVNDTQIEIELHDDGPGIEDLDLAMTPGYSTAPYWAANLGFGAGMGLINMERNADRFEISSRIGEGTRIVCWIDRRNDDAST